MLRKLAILLILALLHQWSIPALFAAAPFHYPEARFGKGELRYINDVPVLIVAGSPQEIGEQVGKLGALPAKRMVTYPEELLKHYHAGILWSFFVRHGQRMLGQFPADYQRELSALGKATGIDRDRLIVANTMFDVKKMLACSAVVVDPERSTTGGPLFGRNLDYPSLGYAHEYSLVTVYRPDGKHAFVSIGFPGLVGALSGMNDAGLSVAVLESYKTNRGDRYDGKGIPYALCYRRLLEECTTVDEAEKLLRTLPRTSLNNLAVCDRNGGAVFEVTPKQVVVRRPDNGYTLCTNHFLTPELRPARQTNNFKTLDRLQAMTPIRKRDRVGLAEVQESLNAASQADHTLQTMIFEPTTLRLHVSIGKVPSSAQELKMLDLKELFKAP